MQTELAREDIKALYEHGVAVMRAGNLAYAIQLFERVAELGQGFYVPFALSSLAEAYRKLLMSELELRTLKRIVELPDDFRLFLDPRWVATCYQKTGGFKAAQSVLLNVLKLTPDEPSILGGLAEVYLLEGNLGEAEKLAERLLPRGEPVYQVLGMVIKAFSLELRNSHDESAAELSRTGQYLCLGNMPREAWDFRDIQTLVRKLGPNARTAGLLMDFLVGKLSPQEFTRLWTETTAPVVA